MEQYLFNLSEPGEEFDGKVEVRQNLWLLSTEEIPPILFTPDEAARMLGICRNRVYALIRERKLRAVQVGASRRVSAAALREYVDALEAQEAS